MKRYSFLFLLLVLLFLFSCRSSNKEIVNNDNLIESEFIGEWCSVKRIIPYTAYLKIDSSYNFSFEGGTCSMRFYSKGSWILNSDTIILNSFKPTGCYYISDFEVTCTIVDTSSSNIGNPYKTSIKDCAPDEGDEYVLFNQEKFIIQNDTLIHVRKTINICPEIKDNFTRLIMDNETY